MSNSRFQEKVSYWVHSDIAHGRHLLLTKKEHYAYARLDYARSIVDPYGSPEAALEAVEIWNKDKRFIDKTPFIGYDRMGIFITPSELRDAANHLISQQTAGVK